MVGPLCSNFAKFKWAHALSLSGSSSKMFTSLVWSVGPMLIPVVASPIYKFAMVLYVALRMDKRFSMIGYYDVSYPSSLVGWVPLCRIPVRFLLTTSATVTIVSVPFGGWSTCSSPSSQSVFV